MTAHDHDCRDHACWRPMCCNDPRPDCTPEACGMADPMVLGRCGRDAGHTGMHRSTGDTFQAYWPNERPADRPTPPPRPAPLPNPVDLGGAP